MMQLAIMISGGGTTAEQIIKACRYGPLKGLVNPALVIASREGIGGISRVIKAGMDGSNVISRNPKAYPTREAFGEALLSLLDHYGIDYIGQHGWLPLTPINVIEAYADRIDNQHPGPLDTGRPDFGGKGMHGRAVHCARLLYARLTGNPADLFTEATTHMVTEEYDRGYVIGRQRVEIDLNDDVISLAATVLDFEHDLQVEVLRQIATGESKRLDRSEPLIPPERIPLLEECKRDARLLFPNG